MKRAQLVALGMIGAAILLGGCRTNVITKVESTGAGTLTTEVGMSPEEVEQLRSLAGEQAAGACESLALNQETGGAAPVFVEEQRGEETWCVSVQAFDDLDTLADLYRDFETVTVRELILREGLVVYDIEVGATAGEGSPAPVEMTWTLELPGKLGSHNADVVNGHQMVWHLTQGEVTRLQASSDLFMPNLPLGLGELLPWILAGVLCLCCGGVLVLVVVVVVLLLRRKRHAGG